MACFALDYCSTLQNPESTYLVSAMAGGSLCGLGGGGTSGGSLLGRHVDGWLVCVCVVNNSSRIKIERWMAESANVSGVVWISESRRTGNKVSGSRARGRAVPCLYMEAGVPVCWSDCAHRAPRSSLVSQQICRPLPGLGSAALELPWPMARACHYRSKSARRPSICSSRHVAHP